MKSLYLIRHAKSSWDDPSLPDNERPLNKRGQSDAPVMGKRLFSLGIKPDLIISSPAKRARQTAEIIARETQYPVDAISFQDNIYLEGVEAILQVIKDQPENNTVFLCGHNPDISILASHLAPGFFSTIPTCGIVYISLDVKTWDQLHPGCGKIIFFDYPKK